MRGHEWVVEAHGCDAAALADRAALAMLFDRMIGDLSLTPVMPATWHQFPDPGGITGFVVLAESHLAIHTFPEHGALCLNLFCCGPTPEWDFGGMLRALLGASVVQVRCLERLYARATVGASSRTTPVSVRIVRA